MGGYILASVLTDTAAHQSDCVGLLCWRWAFLIQVLLLCPLCVGLYFIPKEDVQISTDGKRRSASGGASQTYTAPPSDSTRFSPGRPNFSNNSGDNGDSTVGGGNSKELIPFQLSLKLPGECVTPPPAEKQVWQRVLPFFPFSNVIFLFLCVWPLADNTRQPSTTPHAAATKSVPDTAARLHRGLPGGPTLCGICTEEIMRGYTYVRCGMESTRSFARAQHLLRSSSVVCMQVLTRSPFLRCQGCGATTRRTSWPSTARRCASGRYRGRWAHCRIYVVLHQE
jgi:hypothetical protein